MDFQSKIISSGGLDVWRKSMRAAGKKIVVTNGCFDLLHAGHVVYLEGARNRGDALLVGLNGDAGVRELKGAGRPINNEADRATVLAALGFVDAVYVFPETSAANFLRAAQPDVYVKGGDYTLETLNQEERRIVESGGGKIVIVPFVAGKSTTALVQKIMRL